MNLDMSLFSEEEQVLFEALMRKLEIPKNEVKRKKQSNLKLTNKLSPYVLNVQYTCITCGSTFNTMFNMQPATDGTGLVSSKINEAEKFTADKVSNRSCKSCSYCRTYLRSLDKEQVISLYLNTVVTL